MAQLWSHIYQPATEAELVVHKNKVDEVRKFFVENLSKSFLVLRGPAGSGKATVLRCICNEIGYEVVEWRPDWKGEASRSGSADVHRQPLSVAFMRFLAQTD